MKPNDRTVFTKTRVGREDLPSELSFPEQSLPQQCIRAQKLAYLEKHLTIHGGPSALHIVCFCKECALADKKKFSPGT